MGQTNTCETIFLGIQTLLARDELTRTTALIDQIKQGNARQVLVSGIAAVRAYGVARKEIHSVLDNSWDIAVIKDRSEEGVSSFLKSFADEIRSDPISRRVKFCPTAPKYMRQFLISVNIPCDFALYVIGFDSSSHQEFIEDYKTLLQSWVNDIRGTTNIVSIVRADEHYFLLDTQLKLRESLDRGEQPLELFLTALNRGQPLTEKLFSTKDSPTVGQDGSKHICPNCGFDFSRFSFSQSTSTVQCPRCSTDITDHITVIDLRSEKENRIEREAQTGLSGDDENLARQLVAIQKRLGRGEITEQQEMAEIRKIGEHLCANGGKQRMKRVCYRVMALGGSGRVVEVYWHGLCGWEM